MIVANHLDNFGYSISEQIYSLSEVDLLIDIVNTITTNNSNVKQSESLFSIRNLLIQVPNLKQHLFNNNFKKLVESFGKEYRIVKSIYFDKPPLSNWFVPNHQDLTINVKEKHSIEGFVNWVKKDEYYSVQPPVEYLENIITLRIHLDDTDENNGALIVIPKSQKKGIVRNDTPTINEEKNIVCEVSKGSIMLMKPLLFHKSLRTTNNNRRRVIHLELSNKELPLSLYWSENIKF